jgi:acyl-CoA synthetase (AMP-forming)/AMP-acid ligase II
VHPGDRELRAILTQVYGSSEAPHPVTVLQPADYRDEPGAAVVGSAGRPAYGVDLRLVDADGRELDGPGTGELLVRGPSVMAGYWDDEGATRDVFIDDGGYRSGDLASTDEHGLVNFQDRKRDLIISGGMNVYPSEVERVLAEHPAVEQGAVLGYPDDEWGESVIAYVVTRPGQDCTANELTAWTGGRLAGYKKPRRVEFLDELSLGSTNKVLKTELRRRLWQGRARGIN